MHEQQKQNELLKTRLETFTSPQFIERVLTFVVKQAFTFTCFFEQWPQRADVLQNSGGISRRRPSYPFLSFHSFVLFSVPLHVGH